MKRAMVVSALILLASCMASAQTEAPTFELFGGYSYLRVDPGAAAEGVNTHGWQASGNYNFTRSWGFKADFSGQYCCDGESLYTFMGGPQWAYRADDYTFFVHGLVGGAHANSTTSETALAWAGGGGVDWHFSERWSWRVVQADYLGTNFVDDMQHDFRVSTGVVFRWGKK